MTQHGLGRLLRCAPIGVGLRTRGGRALLRQSAFGAQRRDTREAECMVGLDVFGHARFGTARERHHGEQEYPASRASRKKHRGAAHGASHSRACSPWRVMRTSGGVLA